MNQTDQAVTDITLGGGHESADGTGPFAMSITTPHEGVEFALDNQMAADVKVQLTGEGTSRSLTIDGKEVTSVRAAKETGVDRKSVSVRVTPCPHDCHAEVTLLVPFAWERCANTVQVAPREMLVLVISAGPMSPFDAMFGSGFPFRRRTDESARDPKKS